MLITVAIVVYNAKNTIEQAILSVVNQTYNNLELIIIDGGSSDGTIDILNAFNNKISYWKSEPDNGIYDALNKAVLKASGEYIIFLGADDTLNNIMHEVIPHLKCKFTIYYGNAFMMESKIIYAGRFNALKIAHQNICHQAIFYPRNVFSHYKFNTLNKVHADYELNLLLYSDKRFCFKYINKTISNYSESGFSTKNSDSFYDIIRFKLLKEKFPPLVYCYAYSKYTLLKLIKRLL